MIFKTVSGSEYEIQGDKIRRVNTTATKRGDNDWQTLQVQPILTIGMPATLVLDSLSKYGPDDYGTKPEDASPYTIRTTSTVTEVYNA